jgi:hypothetical protein
MAPYRFSVTRDGGTCTVTITGDFHPQPYPGTAILAALAPHVTGVEQVVLDFSGAGYTGGDAPGVIVIPCAHRGIPVVMRGGPRSHAALANLLTVTRIPAAWCRLEPATP